MSSLRSFDEFLAGAAEWPDELSRRNFLKLMGASIALAGATGCTRNPLEHIVPYQKQPEEIIPGKPLYYASALTVGGYARGVLVETHEGRPTKIEGNPLHPASLGASDVFMQAELLELYNPERSRAVMHAGQISTWEIFLGEITSAATKWKQNGGAGLRLLTRHETSPTLLDQIQRLLAKYPAAKWHEAEPLAPQPIPRAIYHLDRAEVILSLGSDFLTSGPLALRYARHFAARRRPDGGMNRLYVAELTPTLTGAMADHRFVLRPDALADLAREVLAGENAIARDLRAHAGRCLVIAGEYEEPELHALARQLNETFGNTGTTVDYLAETPAPARDLRELVADANAGAVDTLLIISGNPAYDAPTDFEFTQLLKKIASPVHLGLYQDETAALCRWHVPEAHPLESWSDARAFDGTATVMQPMIEPLFAGRSRHELLAALLEEAPTSGYEIVRAFWRRQHAAPDFEQFWRKALHDGVVPGSPASAAAPSLTERPPTQRENGLRLLIRPSSRLLDGRYANNAWLQELPDPQTKIVWDNAALVSPATANKRHLANGDVVNLKFRGRAVRAPVRIIPGQADDCVTIHLGYGRAHLGSVGNGIGFNAGALRTSDSPWGGAGLEIEKTGEHHKLVSTQHHWEMEGRELVRVGTFAEFQKQPRSPAKSDEPPPRADETLYPNFAYPGHAWGMVIDLNTCIGCGVCTIACQAENNIPVVGKEQVAMIARCIGSASIATWKAKEPIRASCISRCRACIARTRPANWSARSPPRCTAARASIKWFTTAASARAIARTTAPTRCAVSIFSSTTRISSSNRSRCKLMRNPNVTVRSAA